MRVAILGTGKMGGAMAGRLHAAGYELTLWNRTKKRAEALALGRVASTPAEAAAGADVVISMLTDARAVRDTYLGQSGAAREARGKVFVEMSTAGPALAKEIAPVVERAGGLYVEAPVLGSIGAIETGKATVLAAGSDEAVERARPVVEAFGEVKRMGDTGSAAALKLVANSMLGGVTALAAELQAAGEAAGLDSEDVFWALSRIAPYISTRKSGLVEHRYEPPTFDVDSIVKDLELATLMFQESGGSTPLTVATRELYEQVARSAGELDMSAIASLYEKQPARRKPG